MPLNENRPAPDYDCTQAALYAGLDMVWDSQAGREADFIAENTKYTAGLSVTRKGAIEAARALPDGQAHYANAEEFGLQLKEQWDTVMGKWNSLSGYIKMAFKGVHYKPRIEEAGKGHYRKALKKNWEYVKLLLQSGKAFIDTHEAVLLADGGMPAGFKLSYNTVKTAFDAKYGEYMGARQTSQEQTDAKIVANNAVYKEGRDMMEDGKHIFRKSASVRERFVWKNILALVTPGSGGDEEPGPDEVSIMGKILHGAVGSTQTIAGAQVTVVETSDTAVSDTDGDYFIEALPPGTYTLVIEKPSYVTKTITGVVVTGDAIVELDINLTPPGAIQGTVLVMAAAAAATIIVVGTALTTTTNAQGEFALSGITAGPQTIRATITGSNPPNFQEKAVDIPPDGTLTVNFNF